MSRSHFDEIGMFIAVLATLLLGAGFCVWAFKQVPKTIIEKRTVEVTPQPPVYDAWNEWAKQCITDHGTPVWSAWDGRPEECKK